MQDATCAHADGSVFREQQLVRVTICSRRALACRHVKASWKGRKHVMARLRPIYTAAIGGLVGV